MDALYEDLEKTGLGDFIHASFFEENTRIMLRPNASDRTSSEHSALYRVLERALSRGVRLRMLANLNVGVGYEAVAFCLQLNLLCGHICCAPEARHNALIGGNLHSKLWIIQHGDDTVVYHGGMDVAAGRWDDQHHHNSPERLMNLDYFGHTAFHDQMTRITGPAVVDYARHFYLRWNDPYPAVFPLLRVERYQWVPPPYHPTSNAGLQMQLLRTVGCQGALQGYYSNFAPRGEYTNLGGFYKMVHQARSTLYLVDQFFNFEEPLRAVKDALPHLQAVIILTNPQTAPALMSTERFYIQYKALSQLLEDPEQRHKVHVFRVVRDDDPSKYIYVHEKMYIADDEYMITGSFGIERSGLTNDLDLGIGICDQDGDYVKMTRKKLWAEHLMLAEDDPRLDDPIVGLQEWIRQADAETGRVRHYFPPKVEKTFITDLFYSLYEPEGRCEY